MWFDESSVLLVFRKRQQLFLSRDLTAQCLDDVSWTDGRDSMWYGGRL